MQGIPLGFQDFKEIREEDLYYVDKTHLVDKILGRRESEVLVLIRPRRFGKSLNLSMLDAYLNMEYSGNNWFEGLSISDIRLDDPE